MKFLKKFNEEAEYDIFKNSNEYITPNVSRIIKEKKVKYGKRIKASFYELPLFVEAIEPLTVKFSGNTIEYSFNNKDWTKLPSNTSTPTVNIGERIYFRASGLTASSAIGIGIFSMTDKCEVGGNAMSMIWGNDFMNHNEMRVNYNLRKLFYKATTIVSAEKMVVGCNTVLNDGCHAMFAYCTSLKKGCKLPAMNLKPYAYCSLYYECSNIEIGSDLPATNLEGATYCYNGMFYKCSNIKYVKAMFLTPSPNNDNAYGAQTGNWFKDASTTGTFVKNANATWNIRGIHGIPSGWDVITAEN